MAINKELIKKYKNEFDHWLDGGDIVVIFTNYGWVNGLSFNWGSNDLDCDIKYIIINDEYAEFRKALAEGKTVQYYVDGFAVWQDVDSVGNHCISGKTNYRIKPEESQG